MTTFNVGDFVLCNSEFSIYHNHIGKVIHVISPFEVIINFGGPFNIALSTSCLKKIEYNKYLNIDEYF